MSALLKRALGLERLTVTSIFMVVLLIASRRRVRGCREGAMDDTCRRGLSRRVELRGAGRPKEKLYSLVAGPFRDGSASGTMVSRQARSDDDCYEITSEGAAFSCPGCVTRRGGSLIAGVRGCR